MRRLPRCAERPRPGTPERVGGQRHDERLALFDLHVAHQVGGKIGQDRNAAATAQQPGAAEGAEIFEAVDGHFNGIGVVRLHVAHPHRFRPKPDGDGTAGTEATVIGAGKLDAGRRDGVGRFELAVEKAHLADEIGDKSGLGPGVDIDGRADLLDYALVHHHDPVGHGQRLLLVVGDHDGGDAEAALKLANLFAKVHPDPGVECRQGLVEQQKARRGGERPRQRHPLLLPA
jgi:hypothetical protein